MRHAAGFILILVIFLPVNSFGAGLVYSTYIGSNDSDTITGMDIDDSGNVYITGYAWSDIFSTTPGSYTTYTSWLSDIFAAKLSPDGSTLVYSTTFGGYERDEPQDIAVDPMGRAYITGYTTSLEYPGSGSFSGGYCDGFVTRITADGSSIGYSCYLGGSERDYPYSIAVDQDGQAYVTGETDSSDFPVTTGAFDTSYNDSGDVFVVAFDKNGVKRYSTFLGGTGHETAFGITADSSNTAYITGEVSSTDFPVTADAIDTTLSGLTDAFISVLNSAGSSLIYSSFLGGSDFEEGVGIMIDDNGNVYLAGKTQSPDFPTTHGVYDTTLNDLTPPFTSDVFVTKLNMKHATVMVEGAAGMMVLVVLISMALVTGDSGLYRA